MNYEHHKIVEWNVCKSTEREKISKKLQAVNPDIIVLTEVTFGIEQYKKHLRGYSCWEGFKETRDNKTIIFTREQDTTEIIKLNENGKNPNWNCVKLSHYEHEYTILGVRFRNYGLSTDELKAQIKQFEKAVKTVKPDVIIGDFNTNSAFSIPKEYSWSAMLTDVKENGYNYVDACNTEASFSYQRNSVLRKRNIGTSPDVLFVRKSSGLEVIDARYHWEREGLTDHAMLIAELYFDDNLSLKGK